MSIRISSYGSDYQRDDDEALDEQRRRNALEMRLRRKQVDQRTIDGLRDARRQEASAQLHESVEASRGLLATLLQEGFRDDTPAASERVRETPSRPSDPSALSSAAAARKPAMAGRNAVASQAPALGGRGKPAGALLADDTPTNQQPATERKLPSSRPAQFAQELDRVLSEIQSRQAEGEAPAERLEEMLRELGHAMRARGVATGEMDEESARRIDGSCRFLSAYIDGLDCDQAQRDRLLCSLEEKRCLIRGEQSEPDLSGAAQPGRELASSTQAQALQDRQTLYAYLELLKSLAREPRDASEMRELAARLAEQQTAEPAAALLRLSGSGDPSVSLYIQEISRQLQRAGTRKKGTDEARMHGALGDWLNRERDNMATALRQAEELDGHVSRKRAHDASRELELRAETMPLMILKNA
jgi:hypothetical protein